MAETRPIQRSTERLAERLDNLERRGVLVRPEVPREPLKPVERREGALKRFLADRGR